MIRRLIILLLIVGCGEVKFTNEERVNQYLGSIKKRSAIQVKHFEVNIFA